MPKVPLTQAAYAARSVIAEAQRCINLYGEKNPEDAQFPYTYYQTPGLTQVGSYTIGGQTFQGSPGVGAGQGGFLWKGVLYLCIGGNLYSVDRSWHFTLIGAVGGGNSVSMAATNNTLMIVNGASGFIYSPTGLLTAVSATGAAITTTGDIAKNSPLITGVASTASLSKGITITGPGITTGSTVQSFTSNTITMSLNATASTSGATLSFGSFNSLTVFAGWVKVADKLLVTLDNGSSQTVTVTSSAGGVLGITPALTDTAAEFNVVQDLNVFFGQLTDAAFLGGSRVDQVDGYFVLTKPNSNEWYISLFELPVFDPLDFASKLTYEDNTSTLICMHGEIWLFGDSKSSEIWYNTGAQDFTFGILPGTIIEHGCAAPSSVAKVDLSVFWLGNDLESGLPIVFQGNAYQAKRISTHAIENTIQSYGVFSDAIGMTYQVEGHYFYVLTFPSGDATWVYDLTCGLWHQWAWSDVNGLFHRHRANFIVTAYGKTIVGDWENGQIYLLATGTWTDNGLPIVRVRGWQHLVQDNKRVSYSQFIADLEVGNLSPANEFLMEPNYPNNLGPSPPPPPPPPVVTEPYLLAFNTILGPDGQPTLHTGWSTIIGVVNDSVNDPDFGTHQTSLIALLEPGVILNDQTVKVIDSFPNSSANILVVDGLTGYEWVVANSSATGDSYGGIFIPPKPTPDPLPYPDGTLTNFVGVQGAPNSVLVVCIVTTPGGSLNGVVDVLFQAHTDSTHLNWNRRSIGFLTAPNWVMEVWWAVNETGFSPNLAFQVSGLVADLNVMAVSLVGGKLGNPFNTNSSLPSLDIQEEEQSDGTLTPISTSPASPPPPPPPPPFPPPPPGPPIQFQAPTLQSNALGVSLVYSDTKGRTWGLPIIQSLGVYGDFANNAQWRRLGMARDRVFEISWALNCEVALNGAFVEFEVAET